MKTVVEIIKILSTTYKILEDPTMDDLGQYRMKDQIITINERMNIDQKREVLIHEVMELISAHLDLGLKHRDIASLAATFAAVLLDNGFWIGTRDDYIMPTAGHTHG
jgi:hypothetical protein